MSIKTFVLDTSVLISAPRAFLAFAEHRVIIPLVVIKELEGQRHDPEIGHSARAALRGIEAIRLKAARLFVVKAGKVIARAPRRESRLDLPGRQLTVDPAAYAPGD